MPERYKWFVPRNHARKALYKCSAFLSPGDRLPLLSGRPAFYLCTRSPDGATPKWGNKQLFTAYYSFVDPEGMKGWVCLVGWPIADGLPTWVVTRQLQVERRTGKVRRSETDVLPPSHAINVLTWCTLVNITGTGLSLSQMLHSELHCLNVLQFSWLKTINFLRSFLYFR